MVLYEMSNATSSQAMLIDAYFTWSGNNKLPCKAQVDRLLERLRWHERPNFPDSDDSVLVVTYAIDENSKCLYVDRISRDRFGRPGIENVLMIKQF